MLNFRGKKTWADTSSPEATQKHYVCQKLSQRPGDGVKAAQSGLFTKDKNRTACSEPRMPHSEDCCGQKI